MNYLIYAHSQAVYGYLWSWLFEVNTQAQLLSQIQTLIATQEPEPDTFTTQ